MSRNTETWRLAAGALLLAAATWVAPARAQDVEAPPLGEWMNTVAARLGGSQVGFQNWQGGGEGSVALTGAFDAAARRVTERLQQKHELKVGLGAVRQGDESFRKAEDELRAATTFEFIGEGFLSDWRPTASASLRTQLLDGFRYTDDTKIRVSAFFAPAYLTESVGLTRQIRPWIKQRFGFAAKQTIVTVDVLRPLYGNALDEKLRFEAGLESLTEVEKQIAENVLYKSRLGVFAAFNAFDEPDVHWENLVSMKVNQWLNVNFELVSVYDLDVIDKVQWKEVLSVGASFVLL